MGPPQTTFNSVDVMLRRGTPSYPLAIPPAPGSWGVWQIRRPNAAPLGYVLLAGENSVGYYDAYAHCRDEGGGRPWLRRFDTLNSAVAWMIQHEREIRAFNAQHDPEPEAWPC